MTKSKVAILLTDYSPKLAPKYGDFADQAITLLKNSSQSFEFQVYDAIKSVFPSDEELRDIKAFWITGSTADSFDNDPWILNLVEFIQNIHNNYNIPFVGICFGHQVIGRALGGKIGRNDKGWELGTNTVEVSNDEQVRELFEGVESFNVAEVHQDVVFEPPQGLTIIGSTEKTRVQGLYARGKILTLQGHPEFADEIVETITNNLYNEGLITKDLFKDSLSSLSLKKNHGTEIGKIIAKFIETS
jgi:GMP synthase-like glutamine amidotransferase